MTKTIRDWLDLLTSLAVTLPFVSLPALVALHWSSRTSEDSLERDLRQRFVAVGMVAILVLGLMWLFSYVYSTADPWPDWYD